jgi:hypothetical protein
MRVGMSTLGVYHRARGQVHDDFRKVRNRPECRGPEDAYAEVAPDDKKGSPQFVITLV